MKTNPVVKDALRCHKRTGRSFRETWLRLITPAHSYSSDPFSKFWATTRYKKRLWRSVHRLLRYLDPVSVYQHADEIAQEVWPVGDGASLKVRSETGGDRAEQWIALMLGLGK